MVMAAASARRETLLQAYLTGAGALAEMRRVDVREVD
jgi:hypothetical protein